MDPERVTEANESKRRPERTSEASEPKGAARRTRIAKHAQPDEKRTSAASEPKRISEANESSSTYFVYILLCRDGAYYVGTTDDLERRLKEHFTCRGGYYTQHNQPTRHVFTERYPTRQKAEYRERQLKGWTRAKKQALIDGNLELLKRL